MKVKRSILFLLLSISSAYGQSSKNSKGLELSAEWLYMHRYVSQPEYVINSSDGLVPIGTRVGYDQNWYSGYRASAKYGLNEGLGEICVDWTHFPQKVETDKQVAQATMGVLNHPKGSTDGSGGESRIEDKYSLRFIDLILKQKLIHGACQSFSLDGGVQYGYLNFDEEVFYPLSFNFYLINIRSRMKGVGPEIGAEYLYNLCSCLRFISSVHTAGLLSLMDKSFQQVDSSSSVIARVENDKYWTFVLSLDLRFGLAYSFPISLKNFRWGLKSWNLNVELGYEMIALFNGMERIYFGSATNPGSSFNEKRTLTLQGAYFQIGAAF